MPTTFHLGGCEVECQDCKKICACPSCFEKNQDFLCLVCKTDSNLLTEETRKAEHLAGWEGISFYPQICSDCWELQKLEN